MSRDLQIGIIGAGRMGRRHAQSLSGLVAGARLWAVADPDLAAAQRAVADTPKARAVASPEQLLADPDVDAVVVCAPTGTHARLIRQAAAAGKHVLCEKPLDVELQRVREAIAAAHAAKITLQVGFNRRFDPGFHSVAEAVRIGGIGALHLLRITSRDPEPPSAGYERESGGLFLDMTIHDFDMARYLAGEEVVEVHAMGSALVDPSLAALGDVDTAITQLRFASGALGSIDNSRRAVYGYDQRVEVFGDAGCLTAGEGPPAPNPSAPRPGEEHDEVPFFLKRYEASYVAELQGFVDCVRAGTEPLVTGRDGLAALALALAADASLREHRPVRVNV